MTLNNRHSTKSLELRRLWKSRIEQLKGKCFFPHIHYNRAIAEFCAVADTFTKGEILLFSGAAGVGKTTLVEDYARAEIGLKPEQPFDMKKMRIPHLVYVEARYPHHRPYRPRLLYLDSLEFLGDGLAGRRLIEQRVAPRHRKIGKGEKVNQSSVRDSQDILLFLLERAFRHHDTTRWIIDEAHDMFIGATEEAVDELLSLIKSIANRNRTLPIISGTYDLACTFDYNAQWNRRATIVHLERYHFDKSDELQEWANIMESYRVALGESMTFNILDHSKTVLPGTAGITGELSGWLVRSMRLALANQKDTVSVDEFKLASHNPAQVRRLNREAIDGEKRIQGLIAEQKKRRTRKSQPQSRRRKSRRYKTGALA
jgi:hypothetical protein